MDAGEECLSAALPCDVAGLVKQFFRELPEPVLPAELQEAFIKAQQLPTEEERTSATMLLSGVLPDRNITTLHHFFDFLHDVSKRCRNSPFHRYGAFPPHVDTVLTSSLFVLQERREQDGQR